MVDHKPGKLVGGERETLLALWQFQRESVVRKVDGVDEAAAASSPVASGTTLLWLLDHLCFAEHIWVTHRFAGRPLPSPPPSSSTAEAVARYRDTWAEVDAVVADASLDDVCTTTGGDDAPVTLRWILMHLLEETARHAGHADILRELVDGDVGR